MDGKERKDPENESENFIIQERGVDGGKEENIEK